jgi:hypothetical protein
MNSEQINSTLKTRCGDQFYGVYSKDALPRNLPSRRPLIIVCNTDPSNQPGEHWVALYIDSHGEYFDSFGRKPEKTFERFMNKHCTAWTFNDKQLQSIVSYFCGQYCVFYALYRSIGFDMNSVISCFTSDTGVNDFIVHKFICRLIK